MLLFRHLVQGKWETEGNCYPSMHLAVGIQKVTAAERHDKMLLILHDPNE